MIAVAAFAPCAAHATDMAMLKGEVTQDWHQSLGPMFENFHRNPELSFVEVRTAARMARELRAVPGMAVSEHVGRTGVVGVLRNGPGPTVLIRADMDALPLKEQSGVVYASLARMADRNGVDQPVMHACGHDTHITSLIGTAHRLAAHRAEWSGTVIFVVQPAEEIAGGARAMLADGLFTRFGKPDFALGFHVAALNPVGRLVVRDGAENSSADTVKIIVHGIGTHGASPQLGKDPIVMGAEIVMGLQTVISREIGPRNPGVITVGTFHGGAKENIIPDRAEMGLTVRADDEMTRQKLFQGIRQVALGVGKMNGMPDDKLPEVIINADEGTPPNINDVALATRVRAEFTRAFGPGVLLDKPRDGMPGDDFAEFGRAGVPSVYFEVGGTPQAAFDAAKAGGPSVAAHHSPFFKVDGEAAVTLGTEAMTVAALDLLRAPQTTRH
jgi:amidohydrolase